MSRRVTSPRNDVDVKNLENNEVVGTLVENPAENQEHEVLLPPLKPENESSQDRQILVPEPIPVIDDSKKMANLSPNSNLKLSKFNYKTLIGEQFKEYVKLVGDRSFKEIVDGVEKGVIGQLKENDLYDFELYKAKPVMMARYVGVPNSPLDFVGITIVNDTPEYSTRIPVKVALLHNAQILNAHSRAGHGKYYLLKKIN